MMPCLAPMNDANSRSNFGTRGSEPPMPMRCLVHIHASEGEKLGEHHRADEDQEDDAGQRDRLARVAQRPFLPLPVRRTQQLVHIEHAGRWRAHTVVEREHSRETIPSGPSHRMSCSPIILRLAAYRYQHTVPY